VNPATLARMNPDRLARLRALPQRLCGTIIGQDEAVCLVAEKLQQGELGLTSGGRPKASFLFLGPTGVGKTELTLTFTQDLLGPGHLLRLDMSEYQTQDSLALLLGTTRGDPGRIAEGFDACAGRGTLLLDEIEKAHRRVLDILLQLLDAGRLTTGGNRVLDFGGWYVVMSSNIGAERIMSLRKSKYESMQRLVREDAQKQLRPEIFARVTEVIVFKKLGYDELCRIAAYLVRREVGEQAARGYALTVAEEILEVIIKRGFDERLGARPMRSAVELLVRKALSEDLLMGGTGCGHLGSDPSATQLIVKR